VITPRKFVPGLLAAFVCLSVLAFAEPQKPTTHHRSRKHQPAEAPLPPYTPHKLTPLPLEQVPVVPPVVTYAGGQLTIVAHNSTLADVLRAVRKQTGADIDFPPSATDRVVTDLGPGPARDVLAALLNGSHFDYVMLGSPADPTHVDRLVLTARSSPETTASAAPPPSQPPNQIPNRFGQTFNATPVPQAQAEDPEPQPDDSANNGDANDDNATDQTADDNSGDQQGQPQTPKTPEQLLQELQRQQQMNQQLNQQLNRNGQPQVVYPNGLPNTNQPGNAPEQ